MNAYTLCKTTKTLRTPEHTALRLTLTRTILACLAAAGCTAPADCRPALTALGGALVFCGFLLFLSGRQIIRLLLGTGAALGGLLLTVWSIWRIVCRAPLAVDVHGSLTGIIIQLCFFAAGIAFIAIPVRRIDRAAKAGMIPVRAQCIASVPEQECILWRYRVGESLYDWKEVRCASFFLPRMGDCCILYADPASPENAVRIERKMAAAQILAGVLLLIEVIVAAAANL